MDVSSKCNVSGGVGIECEAENGMRINMEAHTPSVIDMAIEAGDAANTLLAATGSAAIDADLGANTLLATTVAVATAEIRAPAIGGQDRST